MKKVEETLAKAIGRTIAKKRQELDMTQEFVAEQLDIGYEAVSRIERGAVMPTVARLIEFAEVFECRVDELLLESSPRPADQASRIESILAKLSESDRRLVVEIVEKFAARLQKRPRQS